MRNPSPGASFCSLVVLIFVLVLGLGIEILHGDSETFARTLPLYLPFGAISPQETPPGRHDSPPDAVSALRVDRLHSASRVELRLAIPGSLSSSDQLFTTIHAIVAHSTSSICVSLLKAGSHGDLLIHHLAAIRTTADRCVCAPVIHVVAQTTLRHEPPLPDQNVELL